MATNFPANPSNGDTHAGFTYNSASGAWESSATDINSLTDVDTSTNAPITGQLLQWNGTNWVPYSQIVEVDQWRLNTNLDVNTNPITTGFERVDNASFAKIGTGMSVSNGVWTFPRTGVYEIGVIASIYIDTADSFIGIQTYISTDGGSNWDRVAQSHVGADSSNNSAEQGSSSYFVNVTNTSNVVAQFEFTSVVTGSGNYIRTSTDVNMTTFTFKRLGDSQ